MAEKNVALVTGVSSGIGLATAKKLIERGFHTFGTIRETSQPPSLTDGLEIVRLDVRDNESVREGVQEVLDQAGRIDALINNAGTVLFGSLEETSIDEAKELFDTNFFGVLRMVPGRPTDHAAARLRAHYQHQLSSGISAGALHGNLRGDQTCDRRLLGIVGSRSEALWNSRLDDRAGIHAHKS